VGAVLQDCSSTVSYTLVVASANCLLSPVGAKLRDPISKEYVRYSLEFDNPTSGGSQPVVSGLLAGACANAIGRDVNRHNIKKESSDIFIDFTGTATLAEGAYSDTLTVTLNLH
jgi:spore coat protein U-like protein